MNNDTRSPYATIKRMAKRRAWKWAQSNLAVAEDLEMAGWCAWLESEREPSGARLMCVSRAMRDEWCSWRYHHTYAAKKYRIEVNFLPMETLLSRPDDAPSVEEIIALREIIFLIIAAISARKPHCGKGGNKLMETWWALFLSGKQRIDRDIGACLGLGPWNHRRIYKLREVAASVFDSLPDPRSFPAECEAF